jgi:hypothetical protein
MTIKPNGRWLCGKMKYDLTQRKKWRYDTTEKMTMWPNGEAIWHTGKWWYHTTEPKWRHDDMTKRKKWRYDNRKNVLSFFQSCPVVPFSVVVTSSFFCRVILSVSVVSHRFSSVVSDRRFFRRVTSFFPLCPIVISRCVLSPLFPLGRLCVQTRGILFSWCIRHFSSYRDSEIVSTHSSSTHPSFLMFAHTETRACTQLRWGRWRGGGRFVTVLTVLGARVSSAVCWDLALLSHCLSLFPVYRFGFGSRCMCFFVVSVPVKCQNIHSVRFFSGSLTSASSSASCRGSYGSFVISSNNGYSNASSFGSEELCVSFLWETLRSESEFDSPRTDPHWWKAVWMSRVPTEIHAGVLSFPLFFFVFYRSVKGRSVCVVSCVVCDWTAVVCCRDHISQSALQLAHLNHDSVTALSSRIHKRVLWNFRTGIKKNAVPINRKAI